MTTMTWLTSVFGAVLMLNSPGSWGTSIFSTLAFCYKGLKAILICVEQTQLSSTIFGFFDLLYLDLVVGLELFK